MATPLIEKLLTTLVSEGGSDLHIVVGKPPMIRSKGRLRRLNTETISPQSAQELSSQVMAGNDRFSVMLGEKGAVDLAFDVTSLQARFRVNVCKASGHHRMVLRRLPSKILSIEEIGLPPQLLPMLERQRGLILVTGPTGSGKTTSLAAMVSDIAARQDRHIIMLEYPTEYRIEHGKGIVTQREVGIDVPDFHSGIVDALREDPDVIVVGEMRDLNTMRAALTAAETGHLVFGTLHTSSAAGTINRLVDSFPGPEQATVRTLVSQSLVAVICQALLPKADASGVVAAWEFMVVNAAISNLIRENQAFRITSTMQTGAKEGMRLLDSHLLDLVRSGTVTQQTALAYANDRAQLASSIAQMRRGEE